MSDASTETPESPRASTGPTRLGDRALLRIGGAQAAEFLQGLLPQDVSALDGPVWTGLLTPQGKALFDFLVWPDPAGGSDLLIDAEADRIDALARRLTLYRLRRPVSIAREDALEVHWAPGEHKAPAHADADPRLAELGWRWLMESGSDRAANDDASALWRAHRLARGVTEGVAELGEDKTLWLEANARELNGVSFTKGCYVGQENTARMHHRAKVNRRLMVVPIAETAEDVRIAYPELGLAVALVRKNTKSWRRAPDWMHETE